MALQPCKECDQDVSTLASKCPECGVPYPTANKMEIFSGVILFFIIAIGLIYWLGHSMFGPL